MIVTEYVCGIVWYGGGKHFAIIEMAAGAGRINIDFSNFLVFHFQKGGNLNVMVDSRDQSIDELEPSKRHLLDTHHPSPISYTLLDQSSLILPKTLLLLYLHYNFSRIHLKNFNQSFYIKGLLYSNIIKPSF